MAPLSEAQIAAIYERHGHAVFRRCLHLAGNASDARELLQATFCVFSQSSARFLGQHFQFKLLYRGANALAMDKARRRGDTGGAEAIARASSGQPEDVTLARYLSGDMPPLDRAELEQALANDQAARVRVAVMRSERTAFYASDPPAAFARRVAEIVAARGQPRPPRATSQRALLAALPAAMLVALAIYLLRGEPKLEAVPAPASAPAQVAEAEPPARPKPEPASAPAVAAAAIAPVVAPPPRAASTPASAPTEAARSATDASKMLATFDFGETIGRVSVFEGRAREKAVPAGTRLQMRANIPEDGYVVVLSVDPATLAVRPLTAVLKVVPRWHVIGRHTVDGPQRLYMAFSPEPLVLPRLVAAITGALREDPEAPLPAVARQARIDLKIDGEVQPSQRVSQP